MNYHGASASPKDLPGGAPAGYYLGGLIFVIKFNGALMRPQIPRPISQIVEIDHWKYFDDATVASPVNLKNDLMPETIQRQRPLNFEEKAELKLPKENNSLEMCLKIFEEFTFQQNMKIISDKTKLMLFNMSQKFIYPSEISFSDGHTWKS